MFEVVVYLNERTPVLRSNSLMKTLLVRYPKISKDFKNRYMMVFFMVNRNICISILHEIFRLLCSLSPVDTGLTV